MGALSLSVVASFLKSDLLPDLSQNLASDHLTRSVGQASRQISGCFDLIVRCPDHLAPWVAGHQLVMSCWVAPNRALVEAVHGYRQRDVLAGPVLLVQSTQLVADGLKKVSRSLWARPALIFLPLHDPD